MLKVTSTALSPEGAQAAALPKYEAALRAGAVVGITIRSALNPDAPEEMAVPHEVAAPILEILLSHAVLHSDFLTRKVEDMEAGQATPALSLQKGGRTV